MTSCGSITLRPGPVAKSPTGITRVPAAPCSLTVAPSELSAVTASAAGEALAMLPTKVPTFREGSDVSRLNRADSAARLCQTTQPRVRCSELLDGAVGGPHPEGDAFATSCALRSRRGVFRCGPIGRRHVLEEPQVADGSGRDQGGGWMPVASQAHPEVGASRDEKGVRAVLRLERQ
jgi:hypothetical protein